MLAARLHAPNDLRVEEVPTPRPGPGEVLLDIEMTTLCGTDLRLISGAKTAGVRPGVIMGHEMAGRIAELGDGVDAVVPGLAVGQQATVSIVVSCNRCAACLAGREHLCANLELFGYGIDGGFAEQVLVPARAVASGNVIVTPKDLTPKQLALSEPLSCVLNGAHQFNTQPGDTVVVLGAGPIGLLHAQLARYSGAGKVIVTNRSAGRRELAEELGATISVDPTSTDLDRVVRDATDGAGADVVIVAIGEPSLANQALQLAAIGGRVNYFAGFPKGSTAVMDPNLIHYNELQVTGGSNARRKDVVDAVKLLANSAIDAEKIVSHTFALADFDKALEAVGNRVGVKTGVTPGV